MKSNSHFRVLNFTIVKFMPMYGQFMIKSNDNIYKNIWHIFKIFHNNIVDI